MIVEFISINISNFFLTRFLPVDVHPTTNGSQMTRDRTMCATISSDPPFCLSRDLFSPPS